MYLDINLNKQFWKTSSVYTCCSDMQNCQGIRAYCILTFICGKIDIYTVLLAVWTCNEM